MDVTSPTRMLDRAGSYLPYGYFSARCGMLAVTIASLFIWGFTGFNVVEGGVAGIGIQWSTFATVAFFFYLLMVNFQVGGLKTISEFGSELLYDLESLKHALRHPLETRQEYDRTEAIDPLRAALISALVCMSCLFAFEAVWVPLYDYFQFGSVMWPVYYAVTSIPVIIRNVGLAVLPLLIIPLLFGITLDSPTKERFSVRWRLDFGFAWFLMLAVSCWLVWIAFPHQTVSLTSLSRPDIIGPQASTFNLSSCWIFPHQQFFPQNTYTFYPCALYGSNYTPPQILGFFQSDPWVHLINVLTKFVTFAAICYPFMAFVRRRQ